MSNTASIETIEEYMEAKLYRSWETDNLDQKNSMLSDAIVAILDLFRVPGGSRLQFASTGRIAFTRLNSGVVVGFIIEDSNEVRAQATQVSDSATIILITTGALVALWHLQLSIWSDYMFLPSVRDVEPNHEVIDRNSRVPRGMERIYVQAYTADNQRLSNLAASWYDSAVEQLAHDSRRKIAFHGSFRTTVQWCWMHEWAHVIFGHLQWNRPIRKSSPVSVPIYEDLFAGETSKASDTLANSDLTRSLAFIAEIQADRYATGSLSIGFHRSRTEGNDSYSAKFCGMLVVPLCLHGNLIAVGKTESLRTHPPLWSRAALIRQEYMKALWKYESRPVEQRIKEFLIYHVVANLSELHATYGELLAVVSNSDDQLLVNFENDMLRKAEAFEPRVNSKTRATFAID